MSCPRCRANVTTGKHFCGECGAPLPVKCKGCGSESPAGKRFCGDCGASLTTASKEAESATADQPVAERRQLTVMFVDLVDSTLLGDRLDPEDLREAIVGYQDCITSAVARFDGFVARYMGDGALVYFGYPQAHEDDAERAIRAGLAIIDALRNLSTVAGPAGTLAARVGIATGPVVVGDVIGFGSSLESPVVGGTPNLAARLVSLAEPGMVAIASATQRLAGGLFEYKALGPAQLKGIQTPVSVWAVIGEKPTGNRFEALRTGRLPLVGRSEELNLLLRSWEHAKSGEGGVILLTGEPGIGKSRLVLSLEQRVEEELGAPIRFICSPYHQDSPLYPVIRQIERAARFERGDSPTTKLEKLTRLLEAHASSASDVAVMADLVSIPRAAHEVPVAVQPGKETTLSSILRQFEGLARQNPLLLVFEDIHWADPTTLDLLVMVVQAAERRSLLVVVTTRPELQPPWMNHSQVQTVPLGGLHRLNAASLIKAVAGERPLEGDLIDRIIARADGIPLFIEELTKSVLEALPQRTDGQARHAVESAPAETVPMTLQASLMARLDRLGAAKEVAQIGSVIGRDFSFELLQRLSRLPQEQLERALSQLTRAGLTLAHGQRPHSVYSFKHALVQDAAYTTLLRERRRPIHLRLAEILEHDHGRIDGVLPEVIAWHFAEGQAPDKSIDYYLKAAERTTGRFALAEKAGHLRKALRQTERLPQSIETSRRELALQVALGQTLVDEQGSGSGEILSVFGRARELCLALEDAEGLFRVHDGLLNFHFSHAEPEKVLRYADEMLDIAEKTGNPQAFLMARKSAGYGNLLLGHFEAACENMQRLVETYDGQRDGPKAALATRDLKMGAYTVIGICLTTLGYPDSGAAKSLEAIRHTEALNHVVSQIVALRRACVQYMIQRDAQAVLRHSERLLQLATEFETFKGIRDGTLFNCWARLSLGREPALLKRMQDCIEQFEATQHRAMLPFFMASTAELCHSGGDVAGGAALLDRAAELVELTGERWAESEILRLQARLTARDVDDAVSLFTRSLTVARQQRAKLWELRTATSLASFWLERGAREAAREAIEPVYAWFTEGFGARDLVDARAVLERCSPLHAGVENEPEQGRRIEIADVIK